MTATPAHTLRLFYALWPDDATRAALLRLQAPLAGRLIHHDDLHLTLAFLGAQAATLLPELQAIARAMPAFGIDLPLERLGYFPNSRIAWAGMHATPAALLSLRVHLLEQLAHHGIDGAARGAFRPHVTLARNAPAPAQTAIDTFTWRAQRIVLVESRTQENGVRYRVLD